MTTNQSERTLHCNATLSSQKILAFVWTVKFRTTISAHLLEERLFIATKAGLTAPPSSLKKLIAMRAERRIEDAVERAGIKRTALEGYKY